MLPKAFCSRLRVLRSDDVLPLGFSSTEQMSKIQTFRHLCLRKRRPAGTQGKVKVSSFRGTAADRSPRRAMMWWCSPAWRGASLLLVAPRVWAHPGGVCRSAGPHVNRRLLGRHFDNVVVFIASAFAIHVPIGQRSRSGFRSTASSRRARRALHPSRTAPAVLAPLRPLATRPADRTQRSVPVTCGKVDVQIRPPLTLAGRRPFARSRSALEAIVSASERQSAREPAARRGRAESLRLPTPNWGPVRILVIEDDTTLARS
jgi:hypothetical protein